MTVVKITELWDILEKIGRITEIELGTMDNKTMLLKRPITDLDGKSRKVISKESLESAQSSECGRFDDPNHCYEGYW